jgi:hypothetical protein
MRANLLEQMINHNKNLRELLGSSDRVSSARAIRPSRVPARVMLLQKQANKLHKVLINSWTCDCGEHHSPNIMPQYGSAFASLALQSESDSQEKASKFCILFHGGHDTSPWIWYETEVKISKTLEPEPVDRITTDDRRTSGMSRSSTLISSAGIQR